MSSENAAETHSSSAVMAPEHSPLTLLMTAATRFPLAERRHREHVRSARGREVSRSDRSRCGYLCLEHGRSAGNGHDHGGRHEGAGGIRGGTGPADADRRRAGPRAAGRGGLDRRDLRCLLRRRAGGVWLDGIGGVWGGGGGGGAAPRGGRRRAPAILR